MDTARGFRSYSVQGHSLTGKRGTPSPGNAGAASFPGQALLLGSSPFTTHVSLNTIPSISLHSREANTKDISGFFMYQQQNLSQD